MLTIIIIDHQKNLKKNKEMIPKKQDQFYLEMMAILIVKGTQIPVSLQKYVLSHAS